MSDRDDDFWTAGPELAEVSPRTEADGEGAPALRQITRPANWTAPISPDTALAGLYLDPMTTMAGAGALGTGAAAYTPLIQNLLRGAVTRRPQMAYQLADMIQPAAPLAALPAVGLLGP